MYCIQTPPVCDKRQKLLYFVDKYYLYFLTVVFEIDQSRLAKRPQYSYGFLAYERQCKYIHMYFSQDYNLVSHTTYVLCVNFTQYWRDLQFEVNSERQIFAFSLVRITT